MKISKIFAGMSAMAVAATMAISASAAGVDFTVPDDMAAIGRPSTALYAVFFAGDETEGPVVKDTVKPQEVYGASFTIKVNDEEWNTVGGGGSINFNSASTGWLAHDWAGGSWVDDENPKETLTYTTSEAGTYVVEYIGDAPIFAESDLEEYAAIGINNWAADLTAIEVSGIKVLGEGGSVLYEAGSNLDKVEIQKKPVEDESSTASGAESNTSGTESGTSSAASSTASSSSSAASTTSKTTTTTGTTTTTSTAASSTASDNTNAGTGATAGIALAGLALAGAAAVVSKRK